MATSNLAARCPSCGTVFRVVPAQLRVSEGWVRCGRCSEVFNANAALVDVQTGAPRPAVGVDDAAMAADLPRGPAPTPVDTAAARPSPGPVRLADEPPAAALPDGDGGRPGPASGAADDAQADADLAAVLATLSQDPAAGAAHVADPRAEPDDKPAFVRKAERSQPWQQPRMRAALAALVLLAAGCLAAQLVFAHRDLAAAHWPALRPLLEQGCAALDCRVQAARRIESLGVDSSGLTRVEKSSYYKLQVVLRNRASIGVALPALDLTLTDGQGQLLARRVLQADELGATQAEVPAGSEMTLQATLQTTLPARNGNGATAVAGYTIELFYP